MESYDNYILYNDTNKTNPVILFLFYADKQPQIRKDLPSAEVFKAHNYMYSKCYFSSTQNIWSVGNNFQVQHNLISMTHHSYMYKSKSDFKYTYYIYIIPIQEICF